MAKKPPVPSNAETRHCPVCDTRVGTAATKCIVCGAELGVADDGAGAPPGGQRAAFADGGHVRIPLPVIVAGVMLMLLGGLALVLVSAGHNPFVEPTETATQLPTVVPTFTPAPTSTATQLPTSTPLPPVAHTAVEGDTCILIAVTYDVSVQSILQLNGFTQACLLLVGQEVSL